MSPGGRPQGHPNRPGDALEDSTGAHEAHLVLRRVHVDVDLIGGHLEVEDGVGIATALQGLPIRGRDGSVEDLFPDSSSIDERVNSRGSRPRVLRLRDESADMDIGVEVNFMQAPTGLRPERRVDAILQAAVWRPVHHIAAIVTQTEVDRRKRNSQAQAQRELQVKAARDHDWVSKPTERRAMAAATTTMLWVAIVGVLYSLGVPAIFGYLVHRYHKCGRQATPGERMRHAAVGYDRVVDPRVPRTRRSVVHPARDPRGVRGELRPQAEFIKDDTRSIKSLNNSK